MTTDEVLAVLRERGLEVVLKDGEPALRGNAAEATPKLLRVLKLHRAEILRRLLPHPLREWLWRTGHRDTECPTDAKYGDPAHHPAGAWWWRMRGEEGWHAVPGRGGEKENPPEGA